MGRELAMIYLASLETKTDDKLSGYYPIKTRTELDVTVSQTGSFNRVIIRKDFAEINFTPSGLAEYIEQVKAMNPNVIIELEPDVEAYSSNTFVNVLKGINDIDELIDAAFNKEQEFFGTIRELLDQKIDVNDKLTQAANTIALQQTTNDQLRREIEDLQHQLDIERTNKLYLKNALDTIVGRINFQYGAQIDKKRLFYTDRNQYDKVIYIKEMTRVQYVDSLVYYLQQILKIIHTIPVRVLCIESFYATGKVSLYPNMVPHYSLKEKDVINNDILMLGVQPKLLKDILRNPSNISILIVLDRGGYVVPHIVGDNVEYFYTVSDVKDKPDKVPNARCISYSGSTLNIPLIQGFEDMDPSKKMSMYSSMPIIKKIIEVLNV